MRGVIKMIDHPLLGRFAATGEYRKPEPGEYYLCELYDGAIGLAVRQGLSPRIILGRP